MFKVNSRDLGIQFLFSYLPSYIHFLPRVEFLYALIMTRYSISTVYQLLTRKKPETQVT